MWDYILEENIPVNSLYFAKNGKRFRSLGCTRCTVATDSDASSVTEVLEELGDTTAAERAGRAQDKEAQFVMERLRALGYM